MEVLWHQLLAWPLCSALFPGCALLPDQSVSLPVMGEEDETGRNHVLSAPGICGSGLVPCLVAHPGWGCGEVWLWCLGFAGSTKPPQCLALGLTWILPGGGIDWGWVWDYMGDMLLFKVLSARCLLSSNLPGEASGARPAHCHFPGGKTEAPFQISRQAVCSPSLHLSNCPLLSSVVCAST